MKVQVRAVLFFSMAVIISMGYQNCGVVGSKFVAMKSPSTGNSTFSSGSAEGKAYFDDIVSPQFAITCSSCHTTGEAGGNSKTFIFDYKSVFTLLSTSNSATTNSVYSTVRNLKGTHPGGDVCATLGEKDPVCKSLIEWWKIEFEKSSANSQLEARVLSISEFGSLYGYARSVASPSSQLTIEIYVDGDRASGTGLGSVMASEKGSGGNFEGHYFNFQMSEMYLDGKPHQIYVYAIDAGQAYLIAGKAIPATMYAPKPDGKKFFDENLSGVLQKNCSSCHQDFDYDTYYMALISPTPAQGGTASNNFLIQKISGGKTHSGGNVCGSVNNSPCSLIQQWWAREFN